MSKEGKVILLSFKYLSSPLTNSSNLFNAIAKRQGSEEQQQKYANMSWFKRIQKKKNGLS